MKIMYDRYNEVYAEGMYEGLRIGRVEGINIGRDEGLKIGRTEGINIGRAEGIDIGRKQAELETSVRLAAATIRQYHESVSEAAADIGISEEEFLKTAEMLGITIR
ncbi:MAG: hypothetical protein MR563_03580 [Spirochaetales bacterium]|nr:hypothetical protein [Spirochaetales bacterium]